MATKKSKSRPPARTKRAAKTAASTQGDAIFAAIGKLATEPDGGYVLRRLSAAIDKLAPPVRDPGEARRVSLDDESARSVLELVRSGVARELEARGFTKPAAKPTTPAHEPDVEQALSYLADTRKHIVRALIGLNNSDVSIDVGLEALAEIANLIDVAMLELGGHGAGLAPEGAS